MADCGLLNFTTCLPQVFFEYISGLLNSPLQPLLSMIQGLLSAQVNIQIFSSLWAIMIYVLSMFYSLLILYSGFQLMISGYDVQKRERAKAWLRNIVIMIVLVQASFFIYELAVEIATALTNATLTLVDPNFFILKFDNISNIGLALVFSTMYITTLLTTAIILIIRYAIVAIGVVFFPIAIFCYFVQPLRHYGLLILNFIGIAMFITFLDTLILIGFSKLLLLDLFSNIQILLMVSAFGLINIAMFFLMFFSMIKSAFNFGNKIAGMVAKIAAFTA